MKSGVKPSHLLLLLIVVYFNEVNGQQLSPCPSVFDYKFDGDEWSGTITLPSIGRGRTNLMVILSVEDNLNKDNAGELLLLNNINTLYATVDSGGLLEYKVVFPISKHIPTIKSIKLNKIEYCSNPIVSTSLTESTITVIHSFQTDTNGVQPQHQQFEPIPQHIPRPQPQPVPRPQPQQVPRPQPQVPRPQPQVPRPQPSPPLESFDLETHSRPAHVGGSGDLSWLGSLATSGTCGLKKEPLGDDSLQPVHTIINGVKVEPGEYPWLVALNDQAMRFICGGTLVSNKHVITAAHCIEVRWLYVQLGRHNLKDDSEDIILRTTKEIAIHEDYRPATGHGDIALLTLAEDVRFTDKIKPICLWSFGPGGIGMKGSVVGWGQDISGDQTPEAMQTGVEIVSQDLCRSANKLFQQITSENTYCAGGQGSGPCKGDSGGGMYIRMHNRWYLRGIVSTSLGTSTSCNVDLFAVYADISVYLDWLKTKLA